MGRDKHALFAAFFDDITDFLVIGYEVNLIKINFYNMFGIENY